VPRREGVWRRRLGALLLTAAATAGVVVLLPVLVAGRALGALARPLGLEPAVETAWRVLYWPLIAVLGLALLAVFYRFALPEPTPWSRVPPGALMALLVWVLGGFWVCVYAGWAIDSTTAYGRFAAPLVLMLWLYVTGFARAVGRRAERAADPPPAQMTMFGAQAGCAQSFGEAAGLVRREAPDGGGPGSTHKRCIPLSSPRSADTYESGRGGEPTRHAVWLKSLARERGCLPSSQGTLGLLSSCTWRMG
jgi:hypothetical protein